MITAILHNTGKVILANTADRVSHDELCTPLPKDCNRHQTILSVITVTYGDSVEALLIEDENIAGELSNKWLIKVKDSGRIITSMFANYIMKGDY